MSVARGSVDRLAMSRISVGDGREIAALPSLKKDELRKTTSLQDDTGPSPAILGTDKTSTA